MKSNVQVLNGKKFNNKRFNGQTLNIKEKAKNKIYSLYCNKFADKKLDFNVFLDYPIFITNDGSSSLMKCSHGTKLDFSLNLTPRLKTLTDFELKKNRHYLMGVVDVAIFHKGKIYAILNLVYDQKYYRKNNQKKFSERNQLIGMMSYPEKDILWEISIKNILQKGKLKKNLLPFGSKKIDVDWRSNDEIMSWRCMMIDLIKINPLRSSLLNNGYIIDIDVQEYHFKEIDKILSKINKNVDLLLEENPLIGVTWNWLPLYDRICLAEKHRWSIHDIHYWFTILILKNKIDASKQIPDKLYRKRIEDKQTVFSGNVLQSLDNEENILTNSSNKKDQITRIISQTAIKINPDI